MTVIDQLVDRVDNARAFRRVGSALDFAAIGEQKRRLQSSQAWVLELQTNALQNSRDTGFPVQMEQQLFGVVIALKSVNDIDGERIRTKLDDKRLAVRAALFGYTPGSANGSYEPLTLAGAKLIKLDSGRVFWLERFLTTHQIDQENLL